MNLATTGCPPSDEGTALGRKGGASGHGGPSAPATGVTLVQPSVGPQGELRGLQARLHPEEGMPQAPG